MGVNVHLTAELERFARECVATGRYNNVSEVVRDALRRLQDAEQRRDRFMAMLREVEGRVEREGTVSLDEALAEMDRVIDEVEKTREAQP